MERQEAAAETEVRTALACVPPGWSPFRTGRPPSAQSSVQRSTRGSHWWSAGQHSACDDSMSSPSRTAHHGAQRPLGYSDAHHGALAHRVSPSRGCSWPPELSSVEASVRPTGPRPPNLRLKGGRWERCGEHLHARQLISGNQRTWSRSAGRRRVRQGGGMAPPATAQRGGRRRGRAGAIEVGARHGAPRDGDLVKSRAAAHAARAAPTGSVRAAAAVQVERPVVRVRERRHACRNLGQIEIARE